MVERSRERFRVLTILMSVAILAAALAAVTASRAAADPLTSLNAKDVASATWNGSNVGRTGSLYGGGTAANIGDVNGDDVDDFAVIRYGVGVVVLFTPPSGHNNGAAVTDLLPSQGYVVNMPASGAITAVAGIGDQSGDGVPDVAFGQASSDRVTVAYGISDPSTLSSCSTGTSKCVDTATMPLSAGYVLNGPADSEFGISIDGLGNFTGTSTKDFAIGANAGTGAVYVVPDSLDPTSSPVDVTTLGASDLLTINASQSGANSGSVVSGLGDINDDGFADLYVDEIAGSGTNPPLGFVIYGGSDLANPMNLDAFDANSGFTISPPILTIMSATNGGDVNGDGRPDLAVGGYSPLSPTGSGAVLYGPSSPPTEPVSMSTPTLEQGYAITPGDSNVSFGTPLANGGDLNGDEVPDQLFTAYQTPVGGNSNAGAVNLVFGQRPTPSEPVGLGPDLTPDVGVALVGQGANDRMGTGVAPLGDIDRDGLPDYVVVARGSASAYLVLGSSLLGQAKTGLAGSVGTDRATLGGVGVANDRESTAYFEYGTSNAYGSQTPAQTVGDSSAWESVDADITGLSPDSEVHYRLVVENDLGLKAYGADRTFKTAAEPVPPPNRCVVDPKAAGCKEYTGEQFCKDYPSDAKCKTQPGEEKVAGLSRLIANSKAPKVKRGKKAVVWAWITSTGTKNADGVKVCANVPKRKAKVAGKRCRTVGSLEPGKTAKVKFKIKAKARKGAKVKVKLVASGKGVRNKKTAKVRFTVR